MTMHGAGLGFGIPDPAGGKLSLARDGKIKIAFGYEEFGQGLLSTLELIATDLLGCRTNDLRLVIGDTAAVPHSGSSTASRVTSMVWMALQRLVPPFTGKLRDAAAALTGIPTGELETGPEGLWRKKTHDSAGKTVGDPAGENVEKPAGENVGDPKGETARELSGETAGELVGKTVGDPADKTVIDPTGETVRDPASKHAGDRQCFVMTYRELAARVSEELACETQFHYPTTPDAVMGGHFLYSFAGVAVEAEVNLLTGRVRVTDQFHAVAAGPVVNPMGFLGQIEGGSSMALGFTLTEDAVMEYGQYLTKNLDTYLAPTIADTPAGFELEAIEELPEGDIYGPRGVGEIGSVTLAPAIVSAVRRATGRWVTRLPIRPEELIEDFHISERRVPHEGIALYLEKQSEREGTGTRRSAR
jgi:CO/xanthine dehydrogenase Mo-binding subunit